MPDPIAPGRRALLAAGLAVPGVALALATARAATPEAGLAVIAAISAKPGHVAEVRAALETLAASARREAGCLHYALYEDAGEPGRFFTFERWSGEAALNAHLSAPAMKAAAPRFAGLLASAPEIHKLRSLSA